MKIGESPRVGFGSSPALIVVDMASYLTEPASAAYIPGSRNCLQALVQLLKTARQAGIPRVFTKGGKRYYTQKTVPLTDPERGSWAFKAPLHDQIGEPALWELAPELKVQQDEIVITKTKPSAFFCSPLVAYLNQLGVDTLIIGGMLTDSCLLCTVVDAFQYNFRVIVPLEGVADRSQADHEHALQKIDSSYGDVMTLDEITAHLNEGTQRAAS